MRLNYADISVAIVSFVAIVIATVIGLVSAIVIVVVVGLASVALLGVAVDAQLMKFISGFGRERIFGREHGGSSLAHKWSSRGRLDWEAGLRLFLRWDVHTKRVSVQSIQVGCEGNHSATQLSWSSSFRQ